MLKKYPTTVFDPTGQKQVENLPVGRDERLRAFDLAIGERDKRHSEAELIFHQLEEVQKARIPHKCDQMAVEQEIGLDQPLGISVS
jgi:hypothetical protein